MIIKRFHKYEVHGKSIFDQNCIIETIQKRIVNEYTTVKITDSIATKYNLTNNWVSKWIKKYIVI